MDDQKCADAGVPHHTERNQSNDHLHSLALSNLFKLADTAINGGKLDETPRKNAEHTHTPESSEIRASVYSDDAPLVKRNIMQRRNNRMIHKDYDTPQTSLNNGVRSTLTSVGSQICAEKLCSGPQNKEDMLSNGHVYSRDRRGDARKRCLAVEIDTISVDSSENKQVDSDSAPTRGRKRERCHSPAVKETEKKEDEDETENGSDEFPPLPLKTKEEEKSETLYRFEPADRTPPREQNKKRYPLRAPIERAASANATKQARSHDFIYETLRNLIQKVRAKVDRYGFFSGRVDPIEAECPDYYDVINPVTEAMDLDTMEDMIDEGKLRTIDAFEAYLNRIVFCAKKYNSDEDNFVRMEADKIHDLARPMLDFARQKLEEKPGISLESTPVDVVGTVHDSITPMDDTKGILSTVRRKRRRSQEVDVDFPDTSVSSSTFDMGDVMQASSSNALGARSENPSSKKRRTRAGDKERNSNSDPGTASEPNAQSRPSRAARRNINYCESGPDQLTVPEPRSTPVPTPRRRRAEETTPGLEGSDIPLCKNDLSSSLISSCSSRDGWLSYCHEMILVCNEAARRAALREDPDADNYDKPLSEVYMAERMEYQKPLQGFIVRAKAAPHRLQGFIVTTNFTTWRKSFRWTMDVAAAGITPTDRRLRATDDGSLTSELQGVERLYEGEKSHQGIVFSRVAEIALLGGLGCGGYLVRRALAGLRSSGNYDYVVLQSTKMAIPFYERLGFIRVGAVTRFRDNNLMPEVAYRHWSEIVDGEAIEASYMMALRLNESFNPPFTWQRTSLPVSETTMKSEILEALKSAYSILLIALTIRATGSSSYSNTYRELLTTANDFAVSAQDEHLMNVLKDARKEFTGSQIGDSKKMIREKLDLPKLKDIHRQNSTSNASESEDTENRSVTKITETSDDQSQGKKSVAVNIQVGGRTYSPTGHEHSSISASIPMSNIPSLLSSKSPKRSGDWVHGSVAVSVFLGGSEVLPEQTSEGRRLRSRRNERDDHSPTLEATSYLPSRENTRDLQDSVSTALENLYSFSHEPLPASDCNNESVLHPYLKLGDSIMLKVKGYDGSLLWLPVDVERQCRNHELPKEKVANSCNSFVVKIVEPHGTTRVPRMLDSSNRGVGREWATMTDWHSFSVLPPRILDAILIGSFVNYPSEDGDVKEGTITRRVGGGLDAEPKWRLKIRPADAKVSEDTGEIYEDLKAGALREAVEVSEENMQHALSLLKTMGPPFRFEDNSESLVNKYTGSNLSNVGEGSKAKGVSDTEASRSEAAAIKSENYAAGWAAARFEKYKLGNVAGVSRQGRRRAEPNSQGKKAKLAVDPTSTGLKLRRRGR